ncbi:MAG: glycoside hydrolase family 30 protein [Ignavibacteriales bacterium]|nr:glycoside hydrolase family 30 protein [Ignavibacteriales bacterium]
MKTTIIVMVWCLLVMTAYGQNDNMKDYKTAKVYQSSKSGDKVTLKETLKLSTSKNNTFPMIIVSPDTMYQQLEGFGGAFTQSSASVLNKLSPPKRKEVIDAYFRSDKAGYTLTRTHINSCDFSTLNYAYANTPGDKELKDFSIARDMEDIIPLIKDAMKCKGANFKILASPWTAPPWMKDNHAWNNGSLLPEYYSTWALYFSKYLYEYAKQGINIWAITVENEPENNSGQWESMIFTPVSTRDFVKNHLVPQFQKDNLSTKILIYDHNRDNVKPWVDTLLGDPAIAKYIWGTAVHWYSSTIEWYPDVLNYIHKKSPDKQILQTEGCIDSEIPRWQDDTWYWEKDARDWGYTYATEADKPLHPQYVPVYRYARDIIGGLNSWMAGWIDWNIVLNTQGGPNHAKNWCIAPVIAKPETDEVYFTPLFYVMEHFSKYFRPGAYRIGVSSELKDLMITSCKNPDGTIAIALLNQKEDLVNYTILIGNKTVSTKIEGNALQTLIIE